MVAMLAGERGLSSRDTFAGSIEAGSFPSVDGMMSIGYGLKFKYVTSKGVLNRGEFAP